MAGDGQSRFRAFLQSQGIPESDPLFNATPEMLQGNDPQELLDQAFARQKFQQQQASQQPQQQADPSRFQALKSAAQTGLDALRQNTAGNLAVQETDAQKFERIRRETSQ